MDAPEVIKRVIALDQLELTLGTPGITPYLVDIFDDGCEALFNACYPDNVIWLVHYSLLLWVILNRGQFFEICILGPNSCSEFLRRGIDNAVGQG